MTSWQKFRVWIPQLIGATIGTIAASIAAFIYAKHPYMAGPLIVTTIISGVSVFFTGLDKFNTIYDDGWEEFAPKECEKCLALEAEANTLRKALLEIKL